MVGSNSFLWELYFVLLFWIWAFSLVLFWGLIFFSCLCIFSPFLNSLFFAIQQKAEKEKEGWIKWSLPFFLVPSDHMVMNLGYDDRMNWSCIFTYSQSIHGPCYPSIDLIRSSSTSWTCSTQPNDYTIGMVVQRRTTNSSTCSQHMAAHLLHNPNRPSGGTEVDDRNPEAVFVVMVGPGQIGRCVEVYK